MTGTSGENAAITEAYLECVTEECYFAGLVTVEVDPEDRAAVWRCPACDVTQCIEWEALF